MPTTSSASNAPVPRLCSTCRFCVEHDHGYSNWTVEGTTLCCALGLNDALDGKEQPSSYVYEGDDKKDARLSIEALLRVAEQCARYVEGQAITLDVDGDTALADERDDVVWPELKAIYAAHRLGGTVPDWARGRRMFKDDEELL